MTGIERIAKERKRQIEHEGWTAQHDSIHSKGEMCYAVICYTSASVMERRFPSNWPWEREWWKPSTRVRNLEKAGALIAAEIDRLLRLEEESQ
jgi:hypothetical protein